MIRIAQYRGISLVSRIIRFITRGKYSHTAIMLEDDCIIEAWQGCNEVRIITRLSQGHKPGTKVDIYEIPCTDNEEEWFAQFVMGEVGKKYDYLGLLSFYLNKEKFNREGRWFCSELFVAGCEAAGIKLLYGVKPWQVSPTMVTRSPLPKFIKTVTV